MTLEQRQYGVQQLPAVDHSGCGFADAQLLVPHQRADCGRPVDDGEPNRQSGECPGLLTPADALSDAVEFTWRLEQRPLVDGAIADATAQSAVLLGVLGALHGHRVRAAEPEDLLTR